MNPLQQNIHAYIRLDEDETYVAECMEIAVVTQGQTLDEVSQNLVEAVSLHKVDPTSGLTCHIRHGLQSRPK